MHKLLILFVFFSLAVAAQNNSNTTNQNNSKGKESKAVEEVQIQSTSKEVVNAQSKSYELNVSELQFELKSISTYSTRKTPTALQQEQLHARLKEIELMNDQSFEYHLLKYQIGNYDFTKIESLEEAEKLKPNDAKVMKEFSAYYYIINNEKELNKYLGRLDALRFFTKDLELYANNVLQSLPSNSVLICHGEQDTYPLLIQQKIKSLRLDVEIISLDHLQSDEYRKRLKNTGFKIPKNDIIDTQFFAEFMRLNSDKNIIVAASVPQPYLKMGEKINSVGLGFSFENNVSDDYNLKLYEKGLKNEISNHVNQTKQGSLLTNYLPFLFSVRNLYIEKGDKSSMEEIEAIIVKIGKYSYTSKQVNSLLNK